MGTLKTRIETLAEQAKRQVFQSSEEFRISEELYDKLDFAQQASLPKSVKVVFNHSVEEGEIHAAFLNDEISHTEFERRLDEIRPVEGITDEEFEQVLEKNGSFGYVWTPERLQTLKDGRVPE